MDYLKNERIRPDTTAPGLQEARKRLDVLMMSDAERKQYEHDLDTLVRDTDVMKTQLLEAEIEGRKQGLAQGREEGREEGRKETKHEDARKMKELGVSMEIIQQVSGLTAEEIDAL